jgi:hypothetical protein
MKRNGTFAAGPGRTPTSDGPVDDAPQDAVRPTDPFAGYPHDFLRELRAAGLARPGTGPVVTDADLAPLPPAAQRYLRFMGVVGLPRQSAVLARWTGRFRLRPDGPWLACDAWQYNTANPVARLFRMRLHRGPLAMKGWDVYRDGHGRMHGTLLGLLPVANGSGPRFDTSEQVTWLDDAVLLAPSMLLQPAVSWSADATSDTFSVALTDAGRTVEVTVQVDEAGAPRDVYTDDRYADLPGGLVRARWSTPVRGWTTVRGHRMPIAAHALWQLVGGPFRYAEMAPVDIVADPG